MTLYAIFERADDPAPAVVPERFSWFAALLPPVYALAHGLWLGLVLYGAAVVALVAASAWIGEDAGFWLYVLLAVLVGLEAPALRRRALRARGWTYRTDMIAAAPDLAQREWLSRRSLV